MNEPLVARAGHLLRFAPVFFIGLGCNAILGIDTGHPKSRDGGEDAAITMDDASAAPEADSPTEANPPVVDAPVDTLLSDGNVECTAHSPARPARDDNPMGVAPAMILAVETIQVEIQKGRDLGLDLDGRCSCPDVSVCKLDGKPLDKTCDLAPGGRDVVGNNLLARVAALETAFTEAKLQATIDSGASGMLLRLTDYNGAANDQTVTVELYGKAWMSDSDGGMQKPRRDGTDAWTVYADTVAFGDQAIERDGLAYVNDFTLVAHLGGATVALRPHIFTSDNPLVIELHDAILTGRLVTTPSGPRLEKGTLGGRWPSARILKSFGSLRDANGWICGTSLSYALLSAQVCRTLDIASKQADDNPQSPCNAVSFGLGFTAGPALIASDPKSPVFEPDNCGDDWAPTCN